MPLRIFPRVTCWLFATIAAPLCIAWTDFAHAATPQPTDPRLKIDLFAEAPQVVTPIGVAVDAKGRVFVVESHTHFPPPGYTGPKTDRILMLEDTKGAGKADRVTVFAEDLKWTMCLAFAPDGSLYVATRNDIYRLREKSAVAGLPTVPPDGPQVSRPDIERTRIVHLETTCTYPHDGLEGMAFDFHGDLIFGMGENLGQSYKLTGSDGRSLSGGGEGGNMFRCHADGKRVERIATGFWNPFQCCFDIYGRLWAVDNDPDSRPPCRLVNVVPGGDYGFKFRYGRKGTHPFQAWNGELPGTLPMASAVGEAPAGLLAYESDGLPDEYRGSLLATSWGDHRIDRFELTEHGATAWAKMIPMVTGGEDFRPVSIATAPDGSLYITDWVKQAYEAHGHGRVWHLHLPANSMFTIKNRSSSLHVALRSRDRESREQAAHKMAVDAEGREALRDLGVKDGDPRVRATAIAALADVADEKTDFMAIALHDPSIEIRAMTVRAMPVAKLDCEKLASSDQPAAVRAESLRRAADMSIQGVALQALDEPDPFLQEAARVALTEIVDDLGDLDVPNLPTPAQRLGVMLVLRAADEPTGRKLLPKLLYDSDPNVQFAAIQWIGEEHVTDLRPQILEMLSRGAKTPTLFEACVATLELLDGKQKPDQFNGEQYVAAALLAAETTDPLRAMALRMLRPDHPALTAPRLKSLLTSADPQLQLEAIRTLRTSPLPERFDLLSDTALDAKLPEQLRAEAVVGLADAEIKRETLLKLAADTSPAVSREALRTLRGATLSDAQRAALQEIGKRDSPTAALVAFALKPPTASNPPRHDVDAWLKSLDGPGDVAAGARIFFNPKSVACYRCHQMQGRGAHVGPDLSTAHQMDRRKVVESIVDPSKEIAPQFVPWNLVLDDGRTMTGLLVTEGPGDLETYSDSTGKLFTLSPANIAERHPLKTSIMPEGLPDMLTTQEFRDLVAFLMAEAK